MERITNITPIDEFVSKMTKDELYQEYFNIYQEFDLCLKQKDELETSLKVAKKTKEEVKIDIILGILKAQEHELSDLAQEHIKKEITIVCGYKDK